MPARAQAFSSFTFQRGDSLALALESDPAFDGTEVVSADLKMAVDGTYVPPENSSAVVGFTAHFSSAQDSAPARWVVHLTSAQTQALEAGDYITDAKIAYPDGEVVISQPLGILIQNSISGGATA